MAERKSRSRDEDNLQIAVCDLLRLNGYWPVHVPNQGKRSGIAGWVLKRMGLEPGFPDLQVFDRMSAGGKYRLLIELKRPRKRTLKGGWLASPKPTTEQLAMHAELSRRGYPTIIASSIDEVVAGFAALAIPLNARVMA